MVEEQKPKKQTLLDLYPNEGALLKRVHQYLIAGNANQARSLIESYIIAKREKRSTRDSKRKASNEPKDEKKSTKQKLTKEVAIQIVKTIEQNFDEGVQKNIEDLRKRSDDPDMIKEVADYDRAMKKLKELKEKFNI